MIRIEPDWASELLSNWARSDWQETRQELGMPSVCPSFKGLVETSFEVETTGYSPAEVQAIAAAVEYLHLRHEDHYRALCRHFRPWMRQQMAAKDGDDQRVVEAAKMIADYVDKVLG